MSQFIIDVEGTAVTTSEKLDPAFEEDRHIIDIIANAIVCSRQEGSYAGIDWSVA